ncbi:unnamed protein product [Notodromas monacha]|uniref:Uncharacterized protein n=1 Tax=Notodromas monacha TaxID=399045 RepID=A0A7R9BWB3_9CRUS|nr:unnamed protein product [Notodromas monacha]CAG0922995.1 unnamed protein product [Notodromas monacha]
MFGFSNIHLFIALLILAVFNDSIMVSAHPSRAIKKRPSDTSSASRQRRLTRMTTEDQDAAFLAVVSANFKNAGPEPVYSGSIISPKCVLTYFDQLTEKFWEPTGQIVDGATLTAGVQSSARPTDIQTRFAPIANIVPFPGQTPESRNDVNSLFRNSMALVKVEQAFILGTGVKSIKIARNVGPSLLNVNNLGIYTHIITNKVTLAAATKKANASVEGVECPKSIPRYIGSVNTTVTSCVTVEPLDSSSCVQLPEGSAAVLRGSDDTLYLTAMTKGDICKTSPTTVFLGSSMAFSDHLDTICNEPDVDCAEAKYRFARRKLNAVLY